MNGIRFRTLRTKPWTRAFTLGVILLLTMAAPAQDQGTLGLLPEPISSTDLLLYDERLTLSDAQWLATETLHDEYKRAFEALNEGPIAKFAGQFWNVDSEQSRETLEKMFDLRGKLKDTIAALDRRLFDQLQELLSETQIDSMPRIRMQRHRKCASGEFLYAIIGQDIVDLSELVRELDLSIQQRRELDPLMLPYESTLTDRLREIDEMSNQIFLDVRLTSQEIYRRMDEAEAAEATGDDVDDESRPDHIEDEGSARDQFSSLQEEMRSIIADMTRSARKKNSDLLRYNRLYAKRLASALPEGRGREFTLLFYRKAYPRVGVTYFQAHRVTDIARKFEGLTPEQHDALVEIIDAYFALLESSIEQLTLDFEKADLFHYALIYDREAWQAFQEILQDAQKKIQDQSRTLLKQIRDLVGSEHARILVAAADANWIWVLPQMDAADARIATAGEEYRPTEEDLESNLFFPPRLTRIMLERCAKRLALDDDDRSILNSLYEDYRQSYRTLRARHAGIGQTLHETQRAFYESPETVDPPDESILDRFDRARRDAHDALRRLEDEFFSNVAVALEDPDDGRDRLGRLRLERHREVYTSSQRSLPTFFIGNHSATQVDLSSLLSELNLPEECPQVIDDLLKDYERQLTERLRRRFGFALDFLSNQERLTFEKQRIGHYSLENAKEYQALTLKYVIEPIQRYRELETSITEFNDKMLQVLEQQLSPDEGMELRDTFRIKAYPGVYDDPLAVHVQVGEIPSIEDLPPDARTRIDQLAFDYRVEHEEKSRQLVETTRRLGEINELSIQLLDDSGEALRQYMQLMNEIRQLKFDRRELNIRTIRQLNSMLDADQISHLGGLPDPTKHPDKTTSY